jgi:hypothetical protein
VKACRPVGFQHRLLHFLSERQNSGRFARVVLLDALVPFSMIMACSIITVPPELAARHARLLWPRTQANERIIPLRRRSRNWRTMLTDQGEGSGTCQGPSPSLNRPNIDAWPRVGG